MSVILRFWCILFFFIFWIRHQKANWHSVSNSLNWNWKELAQSIMRHFCCCFLTGPHDWRQQRSDQSPHAVLLSLSWFLGCGTRASLLLDNLADPAMKLLPGWRLIHAWRVSSAQNLVGFSDDDLLSCKEDQSEMTHWYNVFGGIILY